MSTDDLKKEFIDLMNKYYGFNPKYTMHHWEHFAFVEGWITALLQAGVIDTAQYEAFHYENSFNYSQTSGDDDDFHGDAGEEDNLCL